jgi:endonuclease YncB( thermonuclease family)
MMTAILVCTLAAVDPPLKLEKADAGGLPSYRILHVYSGNSVVLKTGTGTSVVRLMGVEAPANVHWRAYDYLASRFLQDLLRGQSVYVRSDLDWNGAVIPGGHAYVYRASDGLLVNLEVIRRGFGQGAKKVAFGLRDLFQVEERKAREGRLGLWAPDATDEYVKITAENQKRQQEVLASIQSKREEREALTARRKREWDQLMAPLREEAKRRAEQDRKYTEQHYCSRHGGKAGSLKCISYYKDFMEKQK